MNQHFFINHRIMSKNKKTQSTTAWAQFCIHNDIECATKAHQAFFFLLTCTKVCFPIKAFFVSLCTQNYPPISCICIHNNSIIATGNTCISNNKNRKKNSQKEKFFPYSTEQSTWCVATAVVSHPSMCYFFFVDKYLIIAYMIATPCIVYLSKERTHMLSYRNYYAEISIERRNKIACEFFSWRQTFLT